MGRLTITLEDEDVRHIVEDMIRRKLSDLDSHGATDRLYNLLFHHARGTGGTEATARIRTAIWDAGRWARTKPGEWVRWDAHGNSLARVDPIGRGVWSPVIHPKRACARPTDRVELPPRYTLAAAKDAARDAWIKAVVPENDE
jgi:hypothetical protein